MTGIATFGNLFDTKRTSKRKLTIKISDVKSLTKRKKFFRLKRYSSLYKIHNRKYERVKS